MPRLKAPQRRQQLLDVATRLFAAAGYDATTTAAIAAAAGVSEPILYRHFKNKQELFIAITREVSRKTLEHWRTLIEGETDPARQIRRVAKQFPRHMKELADAYHVIHNALTISHDRRVLAVLREHYGQIEEFFTRLIKSGQKSGAFRNDVDPKTPAWGLIHMGIGHAMIGLNLLDSEYFSVDQTLELLLDGLKP